MNRSSAKYAVTDEYGAVQPTGRITVAADGSFTVSVPVVAARLDADLNGRKYTIIISAKDNAGNEGRTTVTVVVPHNQAK